MLNVGKSSHESFTSISGDNVLLQRLCKLDSDLLRGVSKIEEEQAKKQENAYCTAQPHY